MKIGIFGGSFNPPHQMHLEIGKELILNGYVDKVIYVPTSKKYPKSSLIDNNMRYQMVKYMIDGESQLDVSDYEFQSDLIYTYQTLDYFKNKFLKDEIYLILGSDLYKDLSKWKNYSYILENYKILVVLRNQDVKNELEKLYYPIEKNVIFSKVDTVTLSSTMIRNWIENNELEKAKNVLKANVLNYILEHGLYR